MGLPSPTITVYRNKENTANGKALPEEPTSGGRISGINPFTLEGEGGGAGDYFSISKLSYNWL
jgi:hypothetical protein